MKILLQTKSYIYILTIDPIEMANNKNNPILEDKIKNFLILLQWKTKKISFFSILIKIPKITIFSKENSYKFIKILQPVLF